MPPRVPPPSPTGAQAEFVARAVAAFQRGSRCLMLSRLETGYWCYRYFVACLESGANRLATSRFLAAQLAPWAGSQRDGDPNTLARFWRVAHILGGVSADDLTEGRAASQVGELSIGKMEVLSVLVIRPEGTEEGRFFSDDPDKQAAAKALWKLTINGKSGITVKELARRVEALRDLATGAEEDGSPSPVEVVTMPLPTQNPNPSDQRGRVEGNLLNPETSYSPQDSADFAHSVLAKSEAPDDALARLLNAVKK
ncbi:MAG TPA: hypothetical protein VFW33_11905, partial [Gemmataceae bacterium]|nr:hypothetical protein [Gemmataceae bacterium]